MMRPRAATTRRRGTPSTPSKGAITWPIRRPSSACASGIGVVYETNTGADPSAGFRRPDRPAPLRRGRASPSLLRGRQHRPRAAAHALRTGRGEGQIYPTSGSSSALSRKVCVMGWSPSLARGRSSPSRQGRPSRYGRLRAHLPQSTNALINTGSGIGMAFGPAPPLKDLEFVQFHPTTLVRHEHPDVRGRRGEGGYLLNHQGERFMDACAPPRWSWRPRDIVARSIQTEINEGRGFDGGMSISTFGTWAARRSSSDCPVSGISAIDFLGSRSDRRADPDPARPALLDGRHRHRRGWPHPEVQRSMRPANAPASASTAPTAWAATRCWRPSSSAAWSPRTSTAEC